MFSTSKLFFTVLAASGVAFRASAGNNRCPNQTRPPRKDGPGKCPEGLSLVEFMDCASGKDEFDNDDKNFNIIRSVVKQLNLTDSGNVTDSSFYLPYDLGVTRTAEALGFDGDSSDEEEVSEFVTGAFSDAQLLEIVQYHIGTERFEFSKLRDGQEIVTYQGESIIMSEKARQTPNCDRRVRMRDCYRDEEEKLAPISGHAKIHNRYQDIEMADDNILQVAKALLLPCGIFDETTTEVPSS